MNTIQVGLLRCHITAQQTNKLSAALKSMNVVMRGITGLIGDQIADQCQEHNVKILVLGSPDPVPAKCANAGVPVLVHRHGAWLRADFSIPRAVYFENFEMITKNHVPFALRVSNAACPQASVLSGDLTPEQVLAVVQSVKNCILVLPEPMPSIVDAQRAGVRCIAFDLDDQILEVIVYVHDDPFSIQFEMKPFVP